MKTIAIVIPSVLITVALILYLFVTMPKLNTVLDLSIAQQEQNSEWMDEMMEWEPLPEEQLSGGWLVTHPSEW